MPDPTLRFLRLWQTIGTVLIGFVVYLSLTPHPIEVPVEHDGKYGHGLAHATMIFWFAQLDARQRTRLAYAIGLVAAGAALE